MSYTERPDSFHKHNRSDIFFANQEPKVNQTNDKYPLKKSTIHFGDYKPEPYKKQRRNSCYNPDVYYDKSSAFERKLKEFYPNHSIAIDSKQNTIGTLKTEFYNDEKRAEFSEPQMSAKERKIRQYHTSRTKEEIQNILEESKVSKEPLLNSYNPSNSCKDNKVDHLKSNIFNDSEKIKIYKKFLNNSTKEKSPPKSESRTPIQNNPWKANIDWKDPKNEILFQKDYAKDEESSPLQRKMKDLQTHLNEVQLDPNFDNLIDKDHEMISKEREEIKESLRDSLNTSQLKLKKAYELSSVQQGQDFYKNNAVKRKTRPVSCFEIKNVKDYDLFEVKKIENLFKNKG